MLPRLAEGQANKLWIIPSEFQQAVGRIGGAVADATGGGSTNGPAPEAAKPA